MIQNTEFLIPQGANSAQACRGDIAGTKCSSELEHPTGRRQAGGGQAEDKSTAAHQAGSFEMQVPLNFLLFSHNFFRAKFLFHLAQVADWRRMSAAVAATHPGPGEHHALACRSSRSTTSQQEAGSPPHQFQRSLSMDRLKQEV